MQIGDAARQVGVAPHVLRHWEDVGALVVRRNASGYRVFDDGALQQARTIRKLRQVGLSLAEVTAAMAPTRAQAQSVVSAKIRSLQDEVATRTRAITFLQHTLECRHRYLDECPSCTAFVGEP